VGLLVELQARLTFPPAAGALSLVLVESALPVAAIAAGRIQGHGSA